MALVLSRKREEEIVIGRNIIVRVISINGDRVKIGVDAPKDVPVMRRELVERKAA